MAELHFAVKIRNTRNGGLDVDCRQMSDYDRLSLGPMVKVSQEDIANHISRSLIDMFSHKISEAVELVKQPITGKGQNAGGKGTP